ncbi:MAG: peptidase E [Candidatus Paceibacterota bacterium]
MFEKKIVAIGGGQIFVPCQPPTTLVIDQEIVRLADERSLHHPPRVLFVPTASGDDMLYCHGMYNVYSARLGCEFDHLRILAERLSDRQIENKINWADIIYVGGGNTLKMMNAWRRRRVDRLLITAYEQGKVMCGLSAGAMCWFDWGLSDSRKFANPKSWKPIRVKGLGLLPYGCCPHHDSEGWRRLSFEKVVKRSYGVGVTIEDNCALAVVGDCFRFISSQPRKSGSLLRWIPPHNLARHPFSHGQEDWRTFKEVLC